MSEASRESLKSLTQDQFAALGADVVGFVRTIDAESLVKLNIDGLDETLVYRGSQYYMLISAAGNPLMISDTREDVDLYLAEQEIGVATLH